MATKTKMKPVTPANMRELAIQLIDYFQEIGCWFDMGIYVDNERWASQGYDSDDEKHVTEKGTEYYVEKNVDIKSRLEYSNPDTISMYFEGPLYHLINYEDYDFLNKLEKKFMEPYNLYFEQGYAWSATAYQV